MFRDIREIFSFIIGFILGIILVFLLTGNIFTVHKVKHTRLESIFGRLFTFSIK